MLGSLIAGLATGETMAALRRMRRAAIAYGLAGIAALAGVIYLLIAGTIWLAQRYGAIEACLGVGVAFIALALLIAVIHKFMSPVRAKAARRQRNSDFTKAALAAGIAVVPTLLKGRAGAALLLVPALAVLADAIYRENTKPEADKDDRAGPT
jgi:Na+-transporting methylmalonyl-CoA/oxaloacetate decarboxylase gamma subunit